MGELRDVGAGGVAGDVVAADVETGQVAALGARSGALQHRQLLAERGDGVARSAVPAGLQVGGDQHEAPDEAQDHEYQHGGHAP